MAREPFLARALAIIVLVALLPWLAILMPGKGAFGFPSAAFVMLIAGPLVVAMLVKSDGDAETGDPEE